MMKKALKLALLGFCSLLLLILGTIFIPQVSHLFSQSVNGNKFYSFDLSCSGVWEETCVLRGMIFKISEGAEDSWQSCSYPPNHLMGSSGGLAPEELQGKQYWYTYKFTSGGFVSYTKTNKYVVFTHSGPDMAGDFGLIDPSTICPDKI
jgi:hypothetical protein